MGTADAQNAANLKAVSLSVDAEEMVRMAVEAAQAKRARDLNVLEIRAVSPIADFFILCSGGSSMQVQAIADAVEESLGNARAAEGYDEGRWICLDFGDVVVHVFREEARVYYDLDRLWGDAPRWAPNGAPPIASCS